MHARVTEDNELDPLDVFLDLGTLVSEARVPGLGESGRGYGEGPHCPLPYASSHPNGIHGPLIHVCSADKLHCQRYQSLRKHAFLLWQNAVPLCIEVLVGPECSHGARRTKQSEVTSTPDPDFLLLERWTISCSTRKEAEASITGLCLVQAVRSFLHFSQLSAWLNKSRGARPQQLLYRITMPGQAFMSKFAQTPVEHNFPTAYVGHRCTHHIKVSVSSLPRTDSIPLVACSKCQCITGMAKCMVDLNGSDSGCDSETTGDRSPPESHQRTSREKRLPGGSLGLGEGLLDPPQTQVRGLRLRSRSRSDSPASLEADLGRIYPSIRGSRSPPARRPNLGRVVDDRMRINCTRPGKHDCSGCGDHDSKEFDGVVQDERKRTGQENMFQEMVKRRGFELKDRNQLVNHSSVHNELERGRTLERSRRLLDKERDKNSRLERGLFDQIYLPLHPLGERGRSRRSRKDCFAGKLSEKSVQTGQQETDQTVCKATEELDKEDNRNGIKEAAGKKSEVCGSRAVPTSDDKLRFQKSLNSAASLVFHTTTSNTSAANGGTFSVAQRFPLKFLRNPPLRMTSSPLLGSFEECLLNGRLEPMSTVEGFRAELGASGSFCPSHELLPVSVFFYSFGGLESDKTGSPYLAHLNLGAKGYQVPRRGTVQLTLFNPQGTVVKMFVILFDLEEMPPNSKTFLRQRTYFMPAHLTDASPQAAKWLRYLIHLRFCSSKTGRIYLHTDIRIIVLRKSDVDTASAHIATEGSYEWKSFTRGPSSPRFSTR